MPPPPADAAHDIGMPVSDSTSWKGASFRNTLDGVGTLTRESHPLRVSQVALFACGGSRPMGRSTLGLRLDERISPICGSSPPGPPRPVCARKAAHPVPPFPAGSWPAQSHTAALSDAYRMYPVDLFSYKAVASLRGCAAAGTPAWNGVRNKPQFEAGFRAALPGISPDAALR